METSAWTTFLKAFLITNVIVLSRHAVAEALEEPDKTISRGGPNDGISYVNFVEDKFFFLNITALGGDTVDDMPECSFACLDTPSCFSFNLAAFPDISNKLLCELLPSDKYNNSDKFMQSDTFHHFSIATPCSSRWCKNNGKCLPSYTENDYKCVCKEGFTGKICESDIDECSLNKCHQNATCTNTKGSYNCTCKDGFVGDGKDCTEIIIEKSVIIGDSQEYLAKLGEWLKNATQSDRHWKLCWRASRDGWAAQTFHTLCDGKSPTVTIVKANDNIFGGFTKSQWGGSARYIDDPDDFLFSLANKVNVKPLKLAHSLRADRPYSIFTAIGYGPTFGNGHDLHISNHANSNSNSYTNLGHTYKAPPGQQANIFLAGTHYFVPSEVETFYLVTKN